MENLACTTLPTPMNDIRLNPHTRNRLKCVVLQEIEIFLYQFRLNYAHVLLLLLYSNIAYKKNMFAQLLCYSTDFNQTRTHDSVVVQEVKVLRFDQFGLD